MKNNTSSRVNFWNTIANIINERFGGTYTGQQCSNRFKNLIRDHTLTEQYIAGSRTGKRSRTGEQYFEEFRSHFWERPETPFDILHNENSSVRRCYRNRTPPPTYRGVTPMSSHRKFTTNQRNRFASPTQRIHSERGENNNRNNVSGDNATYLSSSELANITSGFNISASQNSSDFSIPDVG
ncbi:9664_t:CDS:2, partial [Diversispora eburnea]